MAGNFFTEDILIAIFTCLPLKSIYKFKSVSKVWLAILSDPYFITKWCHYNNTNKSLSWIQYHTCYFNNRLKIHGCPSLYSQFISRNYHGFSFRFLKNCKPFKGKYLNFLGSSKGLVLFDTWLNSKQKSYHVCNPLTQKWISIPSPPIAKDHRTGAIGFFCEYSSSDSTSCYKVVRITTLLKKTWADIFFSKSGEWKTFLVSCPVNISLGGTYDNVVTHDGVLYWINHGRRIVAYNINNQGKDAHKCSFIYLPDKYCPPENHVLGESEGLIYYAKIKRSQGTLSVWVLEEEDLRLLYKDIELHAILLGMDIRRQGENPLSSAEQVQLVGFNPADHHVVLLSCWDYSWEFNIRTRTFEELCRPSLLSPYSTLDDFRLMQTPFVLKPMPTILPPPSWIDT